MSGDFTDSIAHPAETLVDRILAQRSPPGVEGGKDITVRSGELEQFAQVGNDLARQWNLVRTAHLHPLGGDFPYAIVDVELRPNRHAQFAWAGHDMWRDLHGQPRDLVAAVVIHGAQQLAKLFWVEDCSMMLRLRHDQSTAQDRAGVALTPSGRHGIAEDTASERPAAPRCLVLALCLHALQSSQQIDRLDVGDRERPERLQLFEQPVGFLGGRLRLTFGHAFVDVLSGNVAEGVCRTEMSDEFLAFALQQRIYAGIELLACLVTSRACFCKPDVRIPAERKAVLLAHVAILVTPQLGPAGMHFNVQAAIIGVLDDLLRRAEASDFEICERHFRFSSAGPGRSSEGQRGHGATAISGGAISTLTWHFMAPDCLKSAGTFRDR